MYSRKGDRTHNSLKFSEKEELRQHNARGQSFRAARREARERNRNRAQALVRKLLEREGWEAGKAIPAGVQTASATEYWYKNETTNNNKCNICVELRTHGGTVALPCSLAPRVENLSFKFKWF